MANQAQLDRLKLGADAWNQWLSEKQKQQQEGDELDLRDADLAGVALRGINLRGADLSGAKLRGVDLSASDLSMTKWHNADIAEADFTSAVCREADFTGSSLSGACFYGGDISSANFTNAKLIEANLTLVDAKQADFSNADLSKAILLKAQLRAANFSGANLSEARLRWANLEGAIFADANMAGADLREAHLDKATFQVFNLANTANLEGAEVGILAAEERAEAAPEEKPIVNPEGLDFAADNAGLQIYRDDEEGLEVVRKVWYATNRRPIDEGDFSKGYSNEEDTRMHYGTCEVSIPNSRKLGQLQPSILQKLLSLFSSKSADEVKIVSRRRIENQDNYWTSIEQEFAKEGSKDRHALLFIHGFNVSFDEAALRAAQIGFDLKVPGITAFYSWPSKADCTLTGYLSDGDRIEASEQYIFDFITDFVMKSGAKKVHILAHSMGNRGVIRAFQNIFQVAAQHPELRLGQIILAAADVYVSTFNKQAIWCSKMITNGFAERATLYVSESDRALLASGVLHSNSRAGYTPPITIFADLETVEVSGVDLSLLGHGYFGACREVLTDMAALIQHNDPPGVRIGVKDKTDSQNRIYWTIDR